MVPFAFPCESRDRNVEKARYDYDSKQKTHPTLSPTWSPQAHHDRHSHAASKHRSLDMRLWCSSLHAHIDCWHAAKWRQERPARVGKLCDSVYAGCNQWLCWCNGFVHWGAFCYFLSPCNLLALIMPYVCICQVAVAILLLQMKTCHVFGEVLMFDGPVDTVHGHSLILQTAMPTILGYFLYDLLLAALVSDAAMEKLMAFHHVICIIVWPISYHYQAGCFYLLYMMAAELSTPILWLVVYFLPRYKITGPLYIIMGLVLVLVFFLIRVLPGPALLTSLISSQSYWKDVNVIVYGLAMVTLPLPSLLFTYWFARILQGMVAALAGSDKKGAWRRSKWHDPTASKGISAWLLGSTLLRVNSRRRYRSSIEKHIKSLDSKKEEF